MEITIEKIAGGITAVPGIAAAGVRCGIKKDGGRDLALLYSEGPAAAAGTFTTNRVKAPPLLFTEKHIQNPVRAVVINSGNANACTGEQGYRDALATAEAAALELGIKKEEVLVASTGVIGVYLPMQKLFDGLRTAKELLSPEGGHEAAEAIMTTDTVPKETAYRVNAGRESFVVGGMAKGSGMICPDMATMLAFIATDCPALGREKAGALLKEAVEQTFNLITVDGDTSTNDMVLLLSTAPAAGRGEADPSLEEGFRGALERVCRELACMIVADGEGATKVLCLQLKRARDYGQGRKLAMSVLNSALVKTAFFGEDANWGRIITAMGYSGARFDPGKVDIFLGDVKVMEDGRGLVFDEEKAAGVLSGREIPIVIDLKAGTKTLEAWGCDLSYDYVKINSAYRS